MMKMLTVARREYVERVRSKAFIIGTVLGPVLMGALLILPGLLMAKQRGKPLQVAVLDEAGTLGPAVEAALREKRAGSSLRFGVVPIGAGRGADPRANLRERVMKGELDGFVVLPADALERSAAEYYGRNVSNVMDIGLLEEVVADVVVGERLKGAGLQADRVRALTRKLDLKTVRVTAQGLREDRGGAFFLSFALLSLLYTSLAIWGAAIMSGVIEEKANRVLEVVVSSVPATRLFGGKLLGVGGAGLTQFLVWAVALGLVSLYMAGAAAAGGFKLPDLGFAVLAWFVVFFLLGYFIYGALYASIGAAVNTPQEAQSLAFLIMLPLMMGFVFAGPVLSNPDGALSVTLSLIPLFTPLLMFLRVTAVMPPAWQLALSVVLSVGTIVLLNWAAARIYRVGILMYGKKPTLPEILRWVRTG